MKLSELLSDYRIDSRDLKKPYLSSDADVTRWLNEGEEEAALRKNLIFDADSPEVCSIPVTATQAGYDLHESVFYVTRATFTADGETDPTTLDILDRIELDRIRPAWRTTTEEPLNVIVEGNRIRFGCIPCSDGVLAIECYRAPMTPMEKPGDCPEIQALHHRHLIKWALYRAYSRPDTDLFDPDRAATALADFERIFGLRPDADMRRDFKANRPTVNKAIW